ncbi:glutamate receptor 2.2, partial [Quercus suber]
ELQSSTFQIINVNGNGERGFAFWTLENGRVRELNSTNTSTYSTLRRNLGPVIWLGDSTLSPKVGRFHKWEEVEHDASTNTTNVKGYSIDIFKAIIKALPYNVDYEFIPFAKPNGESVVFPLDFVVYLNKGAHIVLEMMKLIFYFDKILMLWLEIQLTNYIDFTLPYTESGVTMVVPIKENDRKNAWVFLKPLTWELWITSGVFLVFIGFVVWALEH